MTAAVILHSANPTVQEFCNRLHKSIMDQFAYGEFHLCIYIVIDGLLGASWILRSIVGTNDLIHSLRCDIRCWNSLGLGQVR